MRVSTAVGCVLVFAASSSADDALKATGRAALDKHKDAVVAVRVVRKVRNVVQGKELGGGEVRSETAGTVIAPDGLTVVSDAAGDPNLLLGGDDGAHGTESQVVDVKIVLADGRELPAKFVLRDRDLDLAFVRPDAKDLNLPHVKLEKATAPAPLDDLIFVYRKGRSLNRVPCVVLGRVEGVLKKPRTFVVPDVLLGLQTLGSPVFDASGRAVGVVVMRRAPGIKADGGGIRDLFELINPVVVTSEDVLDAAAQAVKAKEPVK